MREHEFLRGGGEMGVRMRAHDWTATALGDPATWPGALQHAVRLLLSSKAQIVLFWGPDLVALYNDAYRPVFGEKHPAALGTPGRECWSELWPFLGVIFQDVVRTGDAYWAKARPFFLERHGFSEETYFDVSYDPVRDDTNRVAGVYCIVSETTGWVIGERRLRTLRELGSAGADADAKAVAAHAVGILEKNAADIPYALLYEADGADALRLLAACGAAPLPQAERLNRGQIAGPVIDPSLIAGGFPVHARLDTAVVLPLQAGTVPYGVLVAGLSRHLAFDRTYRDYLELVRTKIGAALADALAIDTERHRSAMLAELDRAKTAFFSNVSHEFRTPLTLILGPLSELQRAAVSMPQELREPIDVAHRNSRRLLKLVNTLLDFSRIEAGRATARFEPTDLCACTTELASTFRSAMTKAGLAFVVTCAPLPEPVHVDRGMWEKIVLNLLSNAFKFTLHGNVTVSIRVAPEASGTGHAELAVCDTGTGIPHDELPHVFERFHRVEGARGRSVEGSGIGLALVHELVKIHGGTLEVTSRVDEGSSFVVRLPFGSAHLPSDCVVADSGRATVPENAGAYVEEALRWLPAEAREDPASLRRRILLVDDNADMREYVRRLLTDKYEIETVPDGAAALRAARRQAPDLVISDVMMPVLDGFALLRELRLDVTLRDVPVILLSARAGEEARVEGLKAGADDYLVKPFSAGELTARVDATLERAAVRREHVSELKTARTEAESANRLKDEFLATLGHELRAPLSSIVGWAHLLQGPPLPPEVFAHGLETIARNADSQKQLVDDLLDMTRIGSGQLRLSMDAVELAPIVHAAVDAMQPAADAKGLRLELEVDLTLAVTADPHRLHQVLWNLLTNAVKFTPHGGRIDVRARAVEDSVEIGVADSGVGVEPSFLPFVFDRFRQADGSAARNFGGLGIGLSIVKQLVELHGGTVRAESAGPGSGATFTVRLPRTAQPPLRSRAPVSPESHANPVQFDGLTVLVVDDEEDARELSEVILAERGAEVACAASCDEALDILLRERPDVIVSDIAMPMRNGYDFIAAVRGLEDAKLRATPAVALTAYAHPDDERRALEAGFDLYLQKPFTPASLVRTVSRLAAVRASREATA